VASRPKTIALTVAVVAPMTTASKASAPTEGTIGIRSNPAPAPANAAIKTGRNQGRGPRDEGDGRHETGPRAGQALDEKRDVRAAHLHRQVGDAKDQEDPANRRVGKDAPQGTEREIDNSAGRDDLRADFA
jgi:hypothetical protein